ncbi:Uncharacterized membrane protein [Anaerovirgula multivorans]|uniref:Uncharacterized membrane protein n=1 Tax=Anaerovirgula multivorans TaxID=312168 RepID=A0A239GRE4_9FIRM|nr:YibE/F family protein [Anaerovirgula multivorans]SNS71796.1 Uncharacterized membrane protein [Anaerovirgula multivorans]
MIKKICLTLIFLIIFISISVATDDNHQIKSKIVNIESISQEELKSQLITVKVLEGVYINEIITINYVSLQASRGLDLKVGHKVLIAINDDENNQLTASILNIDRRDHLLQLGILFLLAVVLFGRSKGFASLISLGLSGLLIIKILIPRILEGYNPIFISVLCAIGIIITSFILIGGFTRKSVAAMIGTIGGTIISGLLANYYTTMVSITGTANEEAIFLMTQVGASVDFRGLFMSGILIGTIGATMDVSMSITSFIFELKKQSPHISFIQLVLSGFNIGKDVMSTMINTLILAYAGASMPLFLIFFGSEINFSYILNTEVVAGEIIRSLCGSIGLVLTIPLTVFIASSMVNNNHRRSIIKHY